MAIIYFLRHFKTEWNERGLLQGSRDFSIVSPATKKLDFVASKIPVVDQIFVSEYKRTQETAVALGLGDFQSSPLLNELNFGRFEGEEKDFLLKKTGNLWIDSPFSSELKENLIALEKSVEMMYQFLISLNKNVLVIGHGAWIRMFIAKYVLKDPNKMNLLRIENGELITFNV